ncbi:hypothetical protein CVT24_006353 [Panaeolus cyanescens]|uniref:DNA sliding clamp PCNA n=1 Tax=Panaeolus cyanescens TaxID=181874 RepID=A0A409YE79_9AGAR|nr:hypothetical protein CVT24_006353 [Panaeolus cyanescens]
MLEAELPEAGTLKKLLDGTVHPNYLVIFTTLKRSRVSLHPQSPAIKELVTFANFECNEEGIFLQALDNSHVALVCVRLPLEAFKKYRCDRPLSLGVNLASLTKVMRCARDDDGCVLRADDEGNVLNLVFEAKNSDCISEYDLKLMEIDADYLCVPDTDYAARVKMPSAEFARIVLRGVRGGGSKKVKDEQGEDGEEEEEGREGGEVKKEKDSDEDVEMDEDNEEEKDELMSDEDEEKPEVSAKTRKAKAASSKTNGRVVIEMESNNPVSHTFALKYLVHFSKSAGLTPRVQLMIHEDVPLLVSFDFDQGYVRYYLAPKIMD